MSAIELYARKTSGFESRLAHTQAVLQSAATEHAGSIVLANSLGAEDMVLTDLIARHQLPIAIGTLLTGKLHAETLSLLQTLEDHYGIQVEGYAPHAEAVVNFIRRHGERAMFESIELRKGCCQLRKLEPLSRMLQGRSAWVTGLRREQSAQRGSVPYSEREASGRLKFNPLAEWTQADIWHYIQSQGVPYNALHDQFFPSIGCEPCTRAIAVGEDFRAGRWWWEEDAAKECGLHIKPQSIERSAA
jgi:phosphoadenosine phosphosulfate reductase